MKKTVAALLAGAALAGFALSAGAEAQKNEISLYGSWEDINEPTDLQAITLNVRYGRFVTPQLLGTAGVLHSRFKGPTVDAASTALTVGAKYYIHAPRAEALVPFLDASIGAAISDDGREDSTDFMWELGGGVAYFLSEATSIDVALRLFHTSTDVTTKGSRFFLGITTRF
jgi:opacity protein-like surface antigen